MPRNFGLRPPVRLEYPLWLQLVMYVATIATVCVIAAGGAALLFGGMAKAHSWYPPECCSDTDCAPMPASQKPTPLPGGAWMLVSGEIVPREKVKWSPDAAFHLCKLPWEPHTTYCLFVPPVGS